MLSEWITASQTLTSPLGRRLGLHREAATILARWARNKEAWARHLDNSKTAVATTLTRAGVHDDARPFRGSIMVLGSGASLDLPTGLRLGRVGDLVLVDLAHPPPIRALARKTPRIHLLVRDVTEYCAAALNATQSADMPVPDFASWCPEAARPVRLLVST